VISKEPFFDPLGPTDVAVIHHKHSTKSLEEFSARCRRGRADITRKQEENEKEPLYCKNDTEIMKEWHNTPAD